MKSRTDKALKNLNMAVISQIINIIFKFVMRSFFVYFLGKEYLGVNGVFSNILTVLSLAELGVGTAIVYDMYKPIAENNTYRVTQFITFYKKVYSYIGIIIFILGIFLLPFLDVIVTDVPNIDNIELIYVLFLIQTCSSYFFAHYSSILSANQCSYVITRVQIIFSIVKTGLEIISLTIFKNYIVYLSIGILSGVLSNYVIYVKACDMFPYIKDKVKPIDKKTIINIFSNTMSMFSIKIGYTMVNATDNIIISAYVSTLLVGIYSNYSLIITTILTLTVIIQQAVLAGVGDLCVEKDRNRIKDIFEKVRFLYAGMYCVIFTCLYSLLTPFIILWLGEDYKLAQELVFIITLNCYLSGIRQPIEMLIYADGLFKYFRIKPWLEAMCNILLSILFVKHFGLLGVFLGTTVSHCVTTFWYDPYIVCKYSIDDKYSSYWIKYIKYFATTIVSVFVTSKILEINILGENFVIRVVVCLVISIGLFLFIFRNNEYFKYYLEMFRSKFLSSLGK